MLKKYLDAIKIRLGCNSSNEEQLLTVSLSTQKCQDHFLLQIEEIHTRASVEAAKLCYRLTRGTTFNDKNDSVSPDHYSPDLMGVVRSLTVN